MSKESFNYPKISDRLIKCLQRDFPDKLPRKYTDSFELGVLAGQQIVIDKLLSEKEYNETDAIEGS